MKRILNSVGLLGLTFILMACNSTAMVPGQPLIELKPAQVNLLPGQQQVFEVTVKGQSNPQMDWSATGGTVVKQNDHQVLYTAGLTPGTFALKAASKTDAKLQAQAAVKINQNLAVLGAPLIRKDFVFQADRVCVSPQEDRIMAIDRSGVLQEFDARTLSARGSRFQVEGNWARTCHWLGHDRLLIEHQMGLRIYDPETHQVLKTLSSETFSTSYASVNQQQQTFLLSSDTWGGGAAATFDFDGNLLQTLPSLEQATWSPDGQWMVAWYRPASHPDEGHLMFYDQNLKELHNVVLNHMPDLREMSWDLDSSRVILNVKYAAPELPSSQRTEILVFDRQGNLRDQQVVQDPMVAHPVLTSANTYLYYDTTTLQEHNMLTHQNHPVALGGINEGNKLWLLSNQDRLEVHSGHLRRLTPDFRVIAQNGLFPFAPAQLFDVLPDQKGFLYGNRESLTHLDGAANMDAAADPSDLTGGAFVQGVSLSYPDRGVFLHTEGMSYLLDTDFKLLRTFKVTGVAAHVQPFQKLYVVSSISGSSRVFDATTQTEMAQLEGVVMARVLNNKLYGVRQQEGTDCELGEIDEKAQFKTLLLALKCQPLDQVYNQKFVVVQKANSGFVLQVHDLITGSLRELAMSPQYDPKHEQFGATGQHLMYTLSGGKEVHFLNLETGKDLWLDRSSDGMMAPVTLSRSADVFASQELKGIRIYQLP